MDRLLNKGSYHRANISDFTSVTFPAGCSGSQPEDAKACRIRNRAWSCRTFIRDTSSILFNHSASWRDIRPDQMVKDG